MKPLLLLIAITTFYSSFAQIPASGVYGKEVRVTLYRDEEAKTVYGSYATCPAGAPATQKCCTFNFKGTYKNITDKKMDIITSWPTDTAGVKGMLLCTSDTTFTIKLKGLPASSSDCGDMEKAGTKLVLLGRWPWIGLAMVQYPHSYFYAKPDEETRMYAFFLPYDVLGILERKNNWVKAAYIGYKNRTPLVNVGWMREQDLFLGAFK